MERSEHLGQLAAAKARAQAAFESIGKGSAANIGGRYSYTYADMATVLAAVVPALSKEGLAVFQPPRLVDGAVVVTTLLVHGESGEWISEDLSLPVVDPTDARSVGSAITYGRRYALQGLLGIASEEEDDDAEQARGGAHELPSSGGGQSCPSCGTAGSVRRNRDGSMSCWRSLGGCERRWATDQELQKAAAATVKKAPEPEANPYLPPTMPPVQQELAATAPAAVKKPAEKAKPQPKPQPKPRPAPKVEVSDVALTAEEEVPAHPEVAPAPPAPTRLVYTIGPNAYETAGMTEAQMRQSFVLLADADRLRGRGTSRNALARILGVPPEKASRNDATEAQAEAWLNELREAIAQGQAAQQGASA
jgi:hypothetical protein